MTNKDRLIQMISNLNENGVNSLLNLFGDFDKIEEFNINTTTERINGYENLYIPKVYMYLNNIPKEDIRIWRILYTLIKRFAENRIKGGKRQCQ